jgi:hypothetical protein
MRRSIREFVELFGFRTEACEGTMGILMRTWEEAKNYLQPIPCPSPHPATAP